MNAKEYINLQVDRARGQFRAAAFISMANKALSLRGKTAVELSLLFADEKSSSPTITLVDAAGALSDSKNDFTLTEGGAVCADNAFPADESMIWIGTQIFYRMESGAMLTWEQHEYLKNHSLAKNQLFADARGADIGFKSAWRSILRTSSEAKSDKSKDILYLTLGNVTWKPHGCKKSVCSPLFLLSVSGDMTAGGIARIKAKSLKFRMNSVLRREIFKQSTLKIYDGCDFDISAKNIVDSLKTVCENINTYLPGAYADADDINLCLLDSQNESVCQVIENNIDKIAASPLARVLAGEKYIPSGDGKETTGNYDRCHSGEKLIFPLAADKSQRAVIGAALAGNSVYVSAPAGTGKSQTAVNIAANLALRGKSVCIMSEKVAAGEVFLNYSERIGLKDYCLTVDGNMRVSDIIRQIKSIVSRKRQYVKTSYAVESCGRYFDALNEYAEHRDAVYTTIPDIGCSLFDLITQYASSAPLPHPQSVRIGKYTYHKVRSLLINLDIKYLSVMSDDEFDGYFGAKHTSDDAELDGLLDAALDKLLSSGLNFRDIVTVNKLKRTEAVASVLADAAGKIADEIIQKKQLADDGCRKSAGIFKALVRSACEMRELYGSLLRQELSARSENAAANSKPLMDYLDKCKDGDITVSELFDAHGADILKLCPIIVTTPTAAVNYIYGTGLDNFSAIIIDEASQMPIISILPFVDRTERLIVFGDDMQLGVTSYFMKLDVSENDDDKNDVYSPSKDRSVLQAVKGNLPSFNLIYHYRSRTEMLIHVSNETCYDGNLRVTPDIYTSREALPKHLGWEILRVYDPDITPRGGNLGEANAILSRVGEILAQYPEKSVGIITFNKIQQALIWDMLEETLQIPADSEKLWVRTLENAQGREADVIFISLTHNKRNRGGEINKAISELHRSGGDKRMNVLFTRAREKNIVVMSFDYKELIGAENANIRRLYDYLAYADKGKLNATTVVKGGAGSADTALTRNISEAIEQNLDSLEATPRLGTDDMTVDIAVKPVGGERYLTGFLLPSYGQTAEEAVTEIIALERFGWSVSPLSPVYYLTHRAQFMRQLSKASNRTTVFNDARAPKFDTFEKPSVGFGIYDIAPRVKQNKLATTPISEDEFCQIDFYGIYSSILPKQLFITDEKELQAMSAHNDGTALLVLLVRSSARYLRTGRKRELINGAARAYQSCGEKRAGYYFAMLLRTDDTDKFGELIERLLTEARELGIG